MYCPICFNQTLKISSTGVVRVTFDKKSKNTSQFFYDLKKDRPSEIDEKFRIVVADYFAWYASFQNKSTITKVELSTLDLICSNGCRMTQACRASTVDLIIPFQTVKTIVEDVAKKYKVPVDIK